MCDDVFAGAAPPTYGTDSNGHLYRIIVRASYHWDDRVVDRKLRRLETCSKCACSLKSIASFFSSAEQPNCRGCSHNAALYPADQAKREHRTMTVLSAIDAAATSGGGRAVREAAVRHELEAVRRARDAALQERDDAIRHKEEAIRHKQEAIWHQEEAVLNQSTAARARDAAILERDAAIQERDAAIREKYELLGAKQGATAHAEAATGDRDAAIRARDTAAGERDAVLTSRRARAAWSNSE